MRIKTFCLPCLLVFLFLNPATAGAHNQKPFYVDNPYFQGKLGLSVSETRTFFQKIKSAFEKNDQQWLASNTLYPLTIRRAGKVTVIANKRDFFNHYSIIVNVMIKKAVRCQSFYNLFINSNGIMIGGGAVWFSEFLVPRDGQRMNSPPSNLNNKEESSEINDNQVWRFKIFAISDNVAVKKYATTCD
ncbi:MAG: hypothetical protein PVG50_05920 [Thiohalophilus sp.]|jgi:hypothetical protein